MRAIFFSLLFFITLPAGAAIQLKLVLPTDTLSVGETQKGKILVSEVSDLSQLPNLAGLIFEDTLYLLDMGPIVNTSSEISSEVVIVFSKAPKRMLLDGKIDDKLIQLELSSSLKITQDKVVEDFIILDSGYSYQKSKRWYLIVITALLVLVGSFLFFRRKKTNNKEKLIKKRLKENILSAVEYEDIVAVWYERDQILKYFPDFQTDYKEFEKVLYKYQFAPHLKKEDKDSVIVAYQTFLNVIKGGLDGV